MDNQDMYTKEQILDFIMNSIDNKGIYYDIENRSDQIIIWFDKDNNFTCKIDSLTIGVSHLKGYRLFNLGEGKESEICSIQYAISHIEMITSSELIQKEIYKMKKLCSTKQYLLINGEEIPCSGLWILHWFHFLPFIKEEKIVKYNYCMEQKR